MNDAKIEIEEGFFFKTFLPQECGEEDKLRTELNQLNLILNKAKQEKDSLSHRKELGKILLSEISAIYPDIYPCAYSDVLIYSESNSLPVKKDIVFIYSKDNLNKSEKEKVENWIKKRLNTEESTIYFIQEE